MKIDAFTSFLLIILFLDSFFGIIIKKYIIRSLIKLILTSEIVSLALLFNLIISKRCNLGFQSAGCKLAIINISLCLRKHFKNIEMLFFTQLNHFSQIFRSLYLSVCHQMVNSFTYYQPFLFYETI